MFSRRMLPTCYTCIYTCADKLLSIYSDNTHIQQASMVIPHLFLSPYLLTTSIFATCFALFMHSRSSHFSVSLHNSDNIYMLRHTLLYACMNILSLFFPLAPFAYMAICASGCWASGVLPLFFPSFFSLLSFSFLILIHLLCFSFGL